MTKQLVEKLNNEHSLTSPEMVQLISSVNHEDADELREYLFAAARKQRERYFDKEVYTRGLIEISNHCKNDCYYCGIRKSNANITRYRLSRTEILEACRNGYQLGFRTFVLQGGEDPSFTSAHIADLVSRIKDEHPDCAVTLSLGETEKAVYQQWFDAGADRYLLRHETANKEHYAKLHPSTLSLESRTQCLYDLKEIGYQVGTGFMVGSPYQTTENLAGDLAFIKELEPAMVGIGPFIPHKDTQFSAYNEPRAQETLVMIALIRLLLPKVLLPATTALGTVEADGRERGILAGANVVMPNLTPVAYREHYALYDGKICTGEEAAECRECLGIKMASIGYHISTSRGDHPDVARTAACNR